MSPFASLPPGGWTAVAFLFGLALGSFLNVCSLRWPVDESVVRPRSRCPGCGKGIAWYDNLPVLSWLALRGRCRNCGERISIQYPLVELATGLVWGGLLFSFGPSWETLRGAVLLTILLGIAVSDARFYIIPDQFSVGGAVIGLLWAAVASATGNVSATENVSATGDAIAAIGIVESAIGAAAGFGILWFVAWAGKKAFKKDAMGGGDIKMMAMIGAFLGIQGVLLSIFLGALLGSVVFGPISMKTGKLVPFGIFLSVGAAVAYLWGDALVGWYLEWAFAGQA